LIMHLFVVNRIDALSVCMCVHMCIYTYMYVYMLSPLKSLNQFCEEIKMITM
jgi:hypothetical protein